jgi:phosphotransacetylase
MASNIAMKPASYTAEAADTAVPRVAQTHEKYERLIAHTKDIPAIRTAVVWPCEEHALAGAVDAGAEEIIAPVLVGSAKRMGDVARKAGIDLGGCTIMDVASEEEAAAAAVRLVRDDKVINPKIPGTTDAAILCKMADRGQITGGLLDGPLAMDNAINPEAAAIKGIHSPVAGRAQILVVPDLEAGNLLAKNLIFLAQADAAGIVLGATVPIILTSRADSVRTRMASTAIGALYAHYLAEQRAAQGRT